MIEVDFTVADEVGELLPDARAELLHIVREALSNSARHSGATGVSVRLGLEEHSLALEVADNGRGFNPATARGAGHLGLANIAARAASAGGSLSVDSAPGRGTRIIVRIPAAPEGKDPST